MMINKYRKRIEQKLAWIVVAGISLAAAACAIGAGAAAEKEAVSAATVTVDTANFPQFLSMIGYIKPLKSETIKWGAEGVIESCSFELGETVARNQVLAALEDEFLSPDIFSAVAAQIQSQATVDAMRISDTAKTEAYQDMIDKEKALEDAKKLLAGMDYPVATADELKAAEKRMIAARDAYEIAVADFEGVKLRIDTDPERYEKKNALQVAMNAYFQANNVFEYYRDGVSEAAKAQARAKVLTAQAAYDQAVRKYNEFGENLFNTAELTEKIKEIDAATNIVDLRRVTASISGVVSASNCEVGRYVKKDDILAIISDTSGFYFQMNVSEFDLDKLSVGMDTDVALDAYGGTVFNGAIASINATPNVSDNPLAAPVYSVLVALDLEQDLLNGKGLYPSMTGVASIHIDDREDILSIPTSALRNDSNGTYVERISAGKVERITVETGEFAGGRVEIIGTNLKAGDQLISEQGSVQSGAPAQP